MSSIVAVLVLLIASALPAQAEQAAPKTYAVRGTVVEVNVPASTVVVKHEAIPAFMPAMTMPFRTKDAPALAHVRAGDTISFRLLVTEDESWIDQIAVADLHAPTPPPPASNSSETNASPTFYLSQIPAFVLTNEFGEPFSFRAYTGNAVALTFFFTRCPIPEFCPRLSKTFAEASQRLASTAGGPTNWHLISISFDPADTPATLHAYALQYAYDSNHWTFVTGAPSDIQKLTRGFGLSVSATGGVFSHDFRTAVFDASGRLQALWPFGGNNTDYLVREIQKGAALTDR